jgi:prepilin-type N-terminal cleavage/methylation domain-containing protein
MSMRNKNAGFTLIEMMLVVMVIAIATAVFANGSVRMYKRATLDSAVRKLLLASKYARVYAIENQTECFLLLNNSDQQEDEESPIENGFLLSAVRANKESGEKEEIVVSNSYTSPVEFSAGIEFEDIQIISGASDDQEQEGSYVVFRPDGTADSALIDVGNGTKNYVVFISATTGKVKILDEDIEQLPEMVIDLDIMEDEGEQIGQ